MKEKNDIKAVKVRNLLIGEGMPKICIPIVGVTKEDIISEAAGLKGLPADLAEWRADWFEDVHDPDSRAHVLKVLRETLGDIPLLLTFRTSEEGGKREIDVENYARLNIEAVRSGYIDLVDVELFTGEEVVTRIIEEAHKAGVKVIVSNHDFDKTPEKEEMIRRLRLMQDLGADIPKIAVMPESKADVLALLAATEEMGRLYADRPIITMSMAAAGVVSRLCGEVFGSALTFGSADKASAPGQMRAEDLKVVLELLHRQMLPADFK